MTGAPMLSDDQRAVVEAVGRIVDGFDDDYWRKADETAAFPHEFARAMADGGWLGIAMPEAVGGAGLGLTEAALLMERVANSAGAMAAASSIHINIRTEEGRGGEGCGRTRNTRRSPDQK